LLRSSSSITNTNPSLLTQANPGSVASYAAVSRARPRDSRPVLIAKFRSTSNPKDCSVATVESMLGLQSDGPIAQDLKVKNGNLFLRFTSEADRDNASKRIKEKGITFFDKVFVPSASHPILVHFNGLMNVNMPSKADTIEDRVWKEKSLIGRLEDDNKQLTGRIISVKVLRGSAGDDKVAYSSSYLVRLCVNCPSLKKSLLDSGRILLEKRSHRALDVDPDKEVRRCLKCQKYGHSKYFCKSASITCGCCSLAHETVVCPVPRSEFKCPNCSGAHEAGNRNCPAQLNAVERYKASFDPK
jgi:hypothetical protein